eukprot:364125-Chlamydomonas_euryale.AAC.2
MTRAAGNRHKEAGVGGGRQGGADGWRPALEGMGRERGADGWGPALEGMGRERGADGWRPAWLCLTSALLCMHVHGCVRPRTSCACVRAHGPILGASGCAWPHSGRFRLCMAPFWAFQAVRGPIPGVSGCAWPHSGRCRLCMGRRQHARVSKRMHPQASMHECMCAHSCLASHSHVHDACMHQCLHARAQACM